MNQRKVRHLEVLFIVAILSMGFYCQDSQLHKANRSAKQIADDLHEFEAKVEEQYAAGVLDKDEAKNLAQLASDASLADDVFVNKVKTLKAVDATNSSLVVGWFQELADDVEKLNAQGVTRIKNEEAKKQFTLIYQGIDTALSALRLVLQLKSELPRGPVQPAQLDPASISLLLMAFNSIAKLVLQARKDGSLTDEQLQQATLDENADTRNHAAEFIAKLESE